VREVSIKDYQIEERILEWVRRESAPVGYQQAYHRCVVCGITWWDDERHEGWCWLPELKTAVENNAKKVWND